MRTTEGLYTWAVAVGKAIIHDALQQLVSL